MPGEKHWYESVTEPLFEESRGSSFGTIREGRLQHEVPTKGYFVHHHHNTNIIRNRNLDKIVTPIHHIQSGNPVFFTSAPPPINTNILGAGRPHRGALLPERSDNRHRQPLTNPVSIKHWLNTNGYKLSDFGLVDKIGSSSFSDIPVFDVHEDDSGRLGKLSYTNNVLATLGLARRDPVPSKQQGLWTASPNRKGKVAAKKKQSSSKHSSKKKDAKTNNTNQQRLAKIMNLVSLLKDYSSLKHKNEKKQGESLAIVHGGVSGHHQRQIAPIIPHQRNGELITSSEQVQEDETASSDTEANWKGELMRISSQANVDRDYHKSLKTSPILGGGSTISSPHHLVTIDTTTGKVYAEQVIHPQDHEDLHKVGLVLDEEGSKKTSLGFIPQQNKSVNGTRRGAGQSSKTDDSKGMESSSNKSSTSPKISIRNKQEQQNNKSAKKLMKNNNSNSRRDILLRRIGKQLSFISTDQLRRLDSTLEKLKHAHKKR